MRNNYRRTTHFMLLTLAGLGVLLVACGDKTPNEASAPPAPTATSTATGDSAATAGLNREELGPLLTKAQLQPEDLPGQWESRDLGLMDGPALASFGGQQTLLTQAILDTCLGAKPEGGAVGADAGVIRTFVSDGGLSSVISTVSRAGDAAALTVNALRQPLTDEMRACAQAEVMKQLGALGATGITIGELRSIEGLPDGTGANVLAITLGTGGSAFTQYIATAGAAQDGLLATSLEVMFVAGSASPTPPLAPDRLAEVTRQRLGEALTSR